MASLEGFAKRPCLVLFDVDGTLVHVAGAGRNAMAGSFRRVFAVDGFLHRTRDVHYAGATDPKIIEALAEALDLPLPLPGRIVGRLRDAYFEELEREMARTVPERRVLPGVLPLLEALENEPAARIGLVTGNFEQGARLKLGAFGLNRFFPSGGFGSDHFDRREIARIALRRMTALSGTPFDPTRVTVVGDTTSDVECARANGFRSVAVCSGWCTREQLGVAGPDAILEDLADTAIAMRALSSALVDEFDRRP